MKLQLGTLTPNIDPSCYIASGAVVIGDVEIGADSSLWYNAVLRGDVYHIRIGCRTNFQDQCVGHVTGGKHALVVGDDVTIGHRAVVHGCTIGNRSLIGIGAIVMDGSEIGEESLVAAGAIVTPNTKIPTGSLAMGAPARVRRKLTQEEKRALIDSASHYVTLAKRHQKDLNILKG